MSISAWPSSSATERQHADVLVEWEIDRIANTPCPLAEREQQIAKLEEEIDRLQRIGQFSEGQVQRPVLFNGGDWP
jgi:hypothetical protein